MHRNLGCKPFSGEFDGQLLEQSPTQRAVLVALDIALDISLGPAIRTEAHVQVNTNGNETQSPARLLGALAAFLFASIALVLLLLLLELIGISQSTGIYIGKALSYSAISLIFVGWKWPDFFLSPFRRISRALRSTANPTANTTGVHQNTINSFTERPFLKTPIQRAIFAVSCTGLLPWFFMRAIRGTWRYGGIERYLEEVFVSPIAPWFESGWWWYTQLEWYDWPTLPALISMAIALLWPITGAKVLAWVRGTTT